MSTAKVSASQEGSLASHHQFPSRSDGRSHVVQFYGEDESLLESLTRFVGGALMAGEAAIVVASRPHREALVRRLKACGLDTTRAAREGRYVSLDAAETLSKFMS